MNLAYPAYVYWPSAQAFYQMTSLQDLEASFAWNDVMEEELTGWDSMGRRFTLAWNEVLGRAYPILCELDLVGLSSTVDSFCDLRSDQDPYFENSDVMDGECSPRAIRTFYQNIVLHSPTTEF